MMNCKDFKENIADLFDKETISIEMIKHLKECDSCKSYYEDWKETFESLIPKSNIDKEFIPIQIMTSGQNTRKTRRHNFGMKIAASIVVVFIITILIGNKVFTTPIIAAEVRELLTSSSMIAKNIGNFSMKFKVRTLEYENFAYINADLPFINHYITAVNIEGKRIWRLSKENGRTVINNGTKQIQWNSEDNKGYVFSTDENIAESFSPLIEPSHLFAYELENAQKSKNDSYIITTTDSTTNLTVTSPRTSDAYPLFINSSLDLSDNIREYIFDKNCGLLKSLRFWIIIDGNKKLILESENISYNGNYDLSEIKKHPDHITEWYDSTKEYKISPLRLEYLKNEKPEKAVRRILNAVLSGDISDAKEALVFYNFKDLKQYYKGYKILEYGETFNSEGMASTYVKVKVRDSCKNIKELRIGVRNDNEYGIWLLDGGM